MPRVKCIEMEKIDSRAITLPCELVFGCMIAPWNTCTQESNMRWTRDAKGMQKRYKVDAKGKQWDKKWIQNQAQKGHRMTQNQT